MIFVVKGAFAQKSTTISLTPDRQYLTVIQLDTPHFCNLSLVKKGGKYFLGFPQKKPQVEQKAAIPVITSNFYTQNFGFFCRKELQLEKATKLPFKFRLGSVQQCDWMEGKPNATAPY
ncbi:hypothetical protein [Ferruginibacter sp.]